MPTQEMKTELERMGLSSDGVRPCPKCGTEVEFWGKEMFNTDSHPTSPLAFHMASCGEKLDEVTPQLPPIKGM
jgi:hypothetical protein